MLALRWTRTHDKTPRSAALPQCYACGSESGGVRREGSKKHTGSPFQPMLGGTATAVFGAIRSGKDGGRGTGRGRNLRGKMDEWIVWEAEDGRVRRGG
jgi:hypothetical protein